MLFAQVIRPKPGKNRGKTLPKTLPKTGAKMPKTGEKPGGSLNPHTPYVLAALEARARSTFQTGRNTPPRKVIRRRARQCLVACSCLHAPAPLGVRAARSVSVKNSVSL